MKKDSWPLGRIFGVLFISFFLFLPGQGFSADGTSFNPTTVSVVAQGTIPVGTVISWPSAADPADMAKWLECNGQAVPAGSSYDRLRAVLGGQPVPNFNGQFLRGTTTAAQVGQQVADSTRSHDHTINPYQYTVSGTIGAQSVTGTAASQYFSGWANGQHFQVNRVNWGAVSVGWSNSMTYALGDYTEDRWTDGGSVSGWTNGGSISGSTSGGAITGVTNVGGTPQTNIAGGAETAPVHTKVRYLIRAIQ